MKHFTFSSTSSFPLPFLRLFGVGHTCPRPPLAAILHIILRTSLSRIVFIIFYNQIVFFVSFTVSFSIFIFFLQRSFARPLLLLPFSLSSHRMPEPSQSILAHRARRRPFADTRTLILARPLFYRLPSLRSSVRTFSFPQTIAHFSILR